MIWYITRRKEMGLFNKLNRNKEEKNMDNAFVATPHFYANADIKLMEKKLMSGR